MFNNVVKTYKHNKLLKYINIKNNQIISDKTCDKIGLPNISFSLGLEPNTYDFEIPYQHYASNAENNQGCIFLIKMNPIEENI